jgi:CheY-like chemotaxis protein
MPHSKLEILVAEDDHIDVELLQRAFADAGMKNPIRVVSDGQAAIDYLDRLETSQDDRAPALILLDLKMPKKDGLEVLQWIRSRSAIKCIPVFMFSSSALSRDVEPAYDFGASIYIVKPPGTAERAEIARFIDYWLRLQAPPLSVSTGVRASRNFRSAWLRFRQSPAQNN